MKGSMLQTQCFKCQGGLTKVLYSAFSFDIVFSTRVAPLNSPTCYEMGHLNSEEFFHSIKGDNRTAVTHNFFELAPLSSSIRGT